MINIAWFRPEFHEQGVFEISCKELSCFNFFVPASNECLIENPAFVIYSSVVSFYVPFIVTLLVYVQIYIVLQKRRKRVNTKRNSRAADAEAHKVSYISISTLCKNRLKHILYNYFYLLAMPTRNLSYNNIIHVFTHSSHLRAIYVAVCTSFIEW